MTRAGRARHFAMLGRLARSYWLLGVLFRRDPDRPRLRIVRLILLHALFPLLAIIAGYADNTTRLQATGGRGVFEHYGFHALFLSAPVLVYLTWRVTIALAKILVDPLPWLSPIASARFRSVQRELQDIALCRPAKLKGLLLLMRVVGVFAVVANADSTRHPAAVYGQDVFDSSQHALGYLTGRLFLGYYWIYLLPLAAYLAIVAVTVAIKLAKCVDELPEYEIRCFASDGCGGFKELGRLMTLVVYLWVPIVVVVLALIETHTNFYGTLRVGACLAIIIPAQLYLPFVRLHGVLSRLKEKKLATLERFLASTEREIDVKRTTSKHDGSQRSITPYLRLLAVDSIYRQTAAISTWPYIKSDVMRWLTPFVPVAMSFALKRLGLT